MTLLLVFLLNLGRSKNGICKEGKHNRSAILIKICRWKRFFVGKEWAMRCVSLVVLEGKKSILIIIFACRPKLMMVKIFQEPFILKDVKK